ncbi:MAG: HAMP domain-containing sensor histidine kinase [Luteolibacter sp.]|uniref:HAMP domain-containing sensor histidine kinase n=1 Tax=Luteolibacter sp. TaxID=1962973 RepID=UPI003265D3E8
MRRWSLKVKVGVYAALLTMAALIAGAAVMMLTLYFYQLSELDEELHGDASELVWDLKNFRDGPNDPRELLSVKFIPVDMREDYLVIEGPEGQILYQSSNLKGALLGGALGRTQTIKVAGHSARVGAWRVDPYVVRIGARLNVIQRFLKDLGIGFATALPAVGLVVFFGGLWLGRRAVSPVAKLSAAAERISANNPMERLPQPAARDEIAKLTEVLNRSFDRLQDSYEIATRFSADASHQLKTPVAILRAGLDHLSRATDLSEAQSAEVSMLRQQTRRLTSLIEDLLLLAQADAGRMFLEKEDLDLKILIQAASDDLQALVEGKEITVEEDLPDSLPVNVDRRLVSMVLQNLVENAAKYTSPGGIVRIAGFQEPEWLVVRISNTGKDIPEEDREHIFERFRRGSSVGGDVRGYGLGLNIAKELLRAHGGELRLNDSEAGWIEFEFRLPVG